LYLSHSDLPFDVSTQSFQDVATYEYRYEGFDACVLISCFGLQDRLRDLFPIYTAIQRFPDRFDQGIINKSIPDAGAIISGLGYG
jgi:hypothetical protein